MTTYTSVSHPTEPDEYTGKVTAPITTPAPPIHLLRSLLFTIATPKITATVPWRMRKILLVPYSINLIPSATLKVMVFSSGGGSKPRIIYHLVSNSIYSLENGKGTGCHNSKCKTNPRQHRSYA